LIWGASAEETNVGSSRVGDFDRFFALTNPSLLRQAHIYTGNAEEARDLVQETLLRTWRNWERVSQLENPDAWARRVLHNLAIGSWRRRRTRRRYESLSTSAADQSETDLHDIASALASLPEKERRVLVSRAVVGLSISEIATERGASEGTVRVWLSRARAAMATELKLTPALQTKRGDDK
jgi:RNA polymerase sigma-70 factor, ECF subfamily